MIFFVNMSGPVAYNFSGEVDHFQTDAIPKVDLLRVALLRFVSNCWTGEHGEKQRD